MFLAYNILMQFMLKIDLVCVELKDVVYDIIETVSSMVDTALMDS
jgi:hypothetical protein